MTWNILKLKCLPDGDNFIVKRILWEKDGKIGESEPHAYFIQPPYLQITKNNVVEWIEAYIGQEALSDFANYISPPLDPGTFGVTLDEPDLPFTQ